MNNLFTENRLAYCGIVYQRGGNVLTDIKNQFNRQRSRGTEGFGFAYISSDNGNTIQRERFTKECHAFFDLGSINSKDVLFHHRIPTSTENRICYNHPIENKSNYKFNYYMVHNGIISNADELYKKHTKEGLGYETAYLTEVKNKSKKDVKITSELHFNDSETLLHELCLFLEGKTDKIGVTGSVAFIMYQCDKKTNKPIKLYFGRNSGNPLKMERTNGVLKIASELKGGKSIDDDVIHIYNYKTNRISKVKQEIGSCYSYSSSWDYKDDWNDYNMYYGCGKSYRDDGYNLKELSEAEEAIDDVAEYIKEVEITADFYYDNNQYMELYELVDSFRNKRLGIKGINPNEYNQMTDCMEYLEQLLDCMDSERTDVTDEDYLINFNNGYEQ